MAIQFLRNVQREAIQYIKEHPEPALKLLGERYETGIIYFSNKDRKRVVNECRDAADVVVCKRIRDVLSTLKYVGKEALREKFNTRKKIERGVQYYTIYEFQSEVVVGGKIEKRTFILKCEAIRRGENRTTEHPYFVRQKE